MSAANTFRALGLLITDNFLSSDECSEFRSNTAQSPAKTAKVVKKGSVEEVDENRRMVQIASVPHAMKAASNLKLAGIKPELERHFSLRLDDCEPPQFLAYGPGHFYVPHFDSSDDEDAPEYMRRRGVSIVIFLNAQSVLPAPDCYGGGSLVFYGLIKEPAFKALGLPLEATAGMLVAFRSAILHEVKPVTHGNRYTIVTWFPLAVCSGTSLS